MTGTLWRRDYVLLLVLIVLVALPFLTGGTYYRFLAMIVMIYAIVAIGLNLLAGYAGQISLGHAAFMAMGAYTSALLSKALLGVPWLATTGLNVWIAMVAGTMVAAASGIVLAVPALRARGPYLAVVTIAFGWVVWKVLQEWVSVTGGDLGITSIPAARFGSYVLTTERFYFVVAGFFLLAFLVQAHVIDSAFGRRMRAMRHNEIAVASVGVDVYRLKIAVFVLSAAFGGFGGALFAHQQHYISPDSFQFFISVFFLLAVLFGGAATLLGPVIGATVLTMLPELLHGFDEYRLIVYGVFILFSLYFLPRGVAGLLGTYGGAAVSPSVSLDATPKTAPPLVSASPGKIALRDVSKVFGGIRALQNVSFEIAPGSIHAIIGPNGAGKTTLINIISGFYKTTSGEVLIDGQPVRFGGLHDAANHGIARTFQTIKLFGDMTVLEHVMVGFARHEHSRLHDAVFRTRRATEEHALYLDRALDLINFVGLAEHPNKPASALAYGHRRLLEIARALAVEPRILLLDEPAAGLVAEEIAALAKVIQRLRTSGVTVILIEHQMDLVTEVSDRITVLDYGAVIAEGNPDEIQRDPVVIEAYLGVEAEDVSA